MVYYKMSHVDGRITNPEQRIASDIPKFCSELSDLVQEDLIAVTDGVLYTWRLCSYASPKYIFWILVETCQLTPMYLIFHQHCNHFVSSNSLSLFSETIFIYLCIVIL